MKKKYVLVTLLSLLLVGCSQPQSQQEAVESEKLNETSERLIGTEYRSKDSETNSYIEEPDVQEKVEAMESLSKLNE